MDGKTNPSPAFTSSEISRARTSSPYALQSSPPSTVCAFASTVCALANPGCHLAEIGSGWFSEELGRPGGEQHLGGARGYL